MRLPTSFAAAAVTVALAVAGCSSRSWQQLSPVGSSPEALDVTPSVWHVATEQGVFASTNDGRTWAPVSGQPGRS